MNSQKIIDILEQYDIDVRTNYSGRGMYGAECVGFVVREDTLLATVAEMVAETEDEDERQDFAKLFRRARTDSMGRDSVIVYFPSMKTNEAES